MFNAVRTSAVSSARSILHQRSIGTTSRLLNGDIYKIQSSKEFEDKVKNIEGPVIVDFFATYVMIVQHSWHNPDCVICWVAIKQSFFLRSWCSPCKMLTPRIESVIGENSGKISLAKVCDAFIWFAFFLNYILQIILRAYTLVIPFINQNL